MSRPWWPTEPSSVATRGAAQQRGALGARAVAKAEQDGHVGRRVGLQRVLQDRQRRDADAAADEDRAPARPRRRKALAERAQRPQPVALAQLAQARACPGRRPRAGSATRRCAGARSRRRAAGTGARPLPRPSARRRRSSRTGPGAARASRRRRRAARGRRRARRLPSTVSSRRANGAGAARPLAHAVCDPVGAHAVQLLQAQHRGLAVAPRAGDRARGGDAGRQRGHAGDRRVTTAARRIS